MTKPHIYDLMRLFWQNAVTEADIRPTDGHFYFYLLEYCNSIGWENPFELSTGRAQIATGLSKKTIVESRERLRAINVIRFTGGEKKKTTPKYWLPVKIRGHFWFPEETKTETKNGNLWFPQGTKTETNNIYNIVYKDSKDSKDSKDIKNAPQRASEPIEKSLFAEEEKKAANRKSPPRTKPPFTPPTLDEVKEYFLSHDADKRLENWEECAQRFYDYFNAVDWIDKNGRRITRWDSRANSWIIDDEKREKENIAKNEIKQQDRFSERRGTEPTATSRKGFKGTF